MTTDNNIGTGDDSNHKTYDLYEAAKSQLGGSQQPVLMCHKTGSNVFLQTILESVRRVYEVLASNTISTSLIRFNSES